MPNLFSAAFIFAKTRLSAVFTVEAALLMALILPVLLSLIYLGFLDHDRGVLQGAACEAAALADNSAPEARAERMAGGKSRRLPRSLQRKPAHLCRLQSSGCSKAEKDP